MGCIFLNYLFLTSCCLYNIEYKYLIHMQDDLISLYIGKRKSSMVLFMYLYIFI